MEIKYVFSEGSFPPVQRQNPGEEPFYDAVQISNTFGHTRFATPVREVSEGVWICANQGMMLLVHDPNHAWTQCNVPIESD